MLAEEKAKSQQNEQTENSEVYYAAKSVFSEPKNFEFRLGTGYDLSNPYMNVFSMQASLYWIASGDFAFGFEGTKYFSSKRSSTETLESELSAYGYRVNVLSPSHSMVGLFRVTPISGLVNFFSSAILSADISVVGRFGMVNYEGQGNGPLVGLALETQVGITPTFGIHSSIQWDMEKPGSNNDWQWRSGFRIGPSLRF